MPCLYMSINFTHHQIRIYIDMDVYKSYSPSDKDIQPPFLQCLVRCLRLSAACDPVQEASWKLRNHQKRPSTEITRKFKALRYPIKAWWASSNITALTAGGRRQTSPHQRLVGVVRHHYTKAWWASSDITTIEPGGRRQTSPH